MDGDDIDGYLAMPQQSVSGHGPYPGVVVIHDAFGHGQDVRTITERFASAGYLAMAPDLYSRGGALRCLRSVFRDLIAARGRAFDDIQAARRQLATRDDCTGRIGIVGYCMGGGFALVASSQRTADGGFAAAAPYYGQLPKDMSIVDGACPIVASFGGRDVSLRGAADRLRDRLEQAGVPHDVKEYPGVGHGFANLQPFGPFNALTKVIGVGYDHEANEDAWRRVQDFFAEHLV